jgi:hypothetical protein
MSGRAPTLLTEGVRNALRGKLVPPVILAVALACCVTFACDGGTVLLSDGAEAEDTIDGTTPDSEDADSILDESSSDGCFPTGPEVCNDQDDNCDGRTDELLWCEVLPFHDGWRWVSLWGSSRTDVWVAGTQVRPDQKGILMRWNGERWTDAAPPGWSTLGPIAGSAPNDLWLGAQITVTDPSAPSSALVHWDGSTWSAPRWLGLHEGVASLFAVGANDVWAVGSFRLGLDIRPLVLRWDGSIWTPQDLPAGLEGAELADVFAGSATDVWAVDGSPLGLVLHWDGDVWSILRPPLVTRQRSAAVWAASAGDVWVSGNLQILHWDGTFWSARTDSMPAYMEDVWGFAADDVWVVGGEETGGGAILHWNGDNWEWSARGLLGAPQAVWGASASEVWAVGEHGIIRRWRQ